MCVIPGLTPALHLLHTMCMSPAEYFREGREDSRRDFSDPEAQQSSWSWKKKKKKKEVEPKNRRSETKSQTLWGAENWATLRV